jgi:hypothetical protein
LWFPPIFVRIASYSDTLLSKVVDGNSGPIRRIPDAGERQFCFCDSIHEVPPRLPVVALPAGTAGPSGERKSLQSTMSNAATAQRCPANLAETAHDGRATALRNRFSHRFAHLPNVMIAT